LPATSNKSSQESDFDILRQGLSRAASESVDEEYGEVTGPPTIAHWKVRRFVLASSFVMCCVCLAKGAVPTTFAMPQKRP
jgi:hypothetical protein